MPAHDGVSLTVTLTPDELGQLVSAAAAHGVDFDDLFERTEFHRPRFNGCLWSSVAAVVLVLSGLAWGLRVLLG